MAAIQKEALLKRIQTIDNDELVDILNDEIAFFLSEKDVVGCISAIDRQELQQLVNEPFGFETESAEDFTKATDKWRTK